MSGSSTTGARPIDPASWTDERFHRHRGPDGDGFLLEPGIGLGTAASPSSTLRAAAAALQRDRRRVVVFNGEIYNYRETMGS